MDDDEEPVRQNDRMEQAVKDPVSGRDITGDFVAESKKDLRTGLAGIYDEAKKRLAHGDEPKVIEAELSVRLEDLVMRHFRNMKLPPDEGIVMLYRMHLREILGAADDR